MFTLFSIDLTVQYILHSFKTVNAATLGSQPNHSYAPVNSKFKIINSQVSWDAQQAWEISENNETTETQIQETGAAQLASWKLDGLETSSVLMLLIFEETSTVVMHYEKELNFVMMVGINVYLLRLFLEILQAAVISVLQQINTSV